MPDILSILDNLPNNEDRRRFNLIRANMRKAALMAIQASIGVENFNGDDNHFLDALDIQVVMLMERAGLIPQIYFSNPFSHITSPKSLIAFEAEIKENLKKALEAPETTTGWAATEKDKIQ